MQRLDLTLAVSMLLLGQAIGMCRPLSNGVQFNQQPAHMAKARVRCGQPLAAMDSNRSSARPRRTTRVAARSEPLAAIDDEDLPTATEVLRGRLKNALENAPPEFATVLASEDTDFRVLATDLRRLVGAELAPRVAGLAQPTPDILAAAKPPSQLGDFEVRAAELMADECWLEAHDVVAGQLLEFASAEDGAHAHEAVLVARLLEGVCQHQLACQGGLAAALASHEAVKVVPLPCGCTVSPEAVEPFADLANALLALDDGDANLALGHALAAALGRQSLAPTAARIARRAEEILELLPADAPPGGTVVDDGDVGGRVGKGLEKASRSPGSPTYDWAEEERLPSLAAMQALVGLKDVKERCQNLKDAVALEKERGDDPKQKLFSLVLTGNPGTGKSTFAALYGELLGDLHVVPKGRVVRITGAQLQDDGVKGLGEILEKFDEPGDTTLGVGDTVEVKREGKWGHFGRIVHHDTSKDARPQFRDTYDVHFGAIVKFKLSDGGTMTRRDSDFDIGVRRKDIRGTDEAGGVLIIDDAHQLDPNDKSARQVLYLLADEMDKRGGKLAVVMAGYEKSLYEQVLSFNNGALQSRFRRKYDLPDFTDEELIELLRGQLESTKARYHVVDKYLRIAARRVGKGRGSLGFGNARAIQTLLDVASEKQTARVVAERKEGLQPDIFEVCAVGPSLASPPRIAADVAVAPLLPMSSRQHVCAQLSSRHRSSNARTFSASHPSCSTPRAASRCACYATWRASARSRLR